MRGDDAENTQTENDSGGSASTVPVATQNDESVNVTRMPDFPSPAPCSVPKNSSVAQYWAKSYSVPLSVNATLLAPQSATAEHLVTAPQPSTLTTGHDATAPTMHVLPVIVRDHHVETMGYYSAPSWLTASAFQEWASAHTFVAQNYHSPQFLHPEYFPTVSTTHNFPVYHPVSEDSITKNGIPSTVEALTAPTTHHHRENTIVLSSPATVENQTLHYQQAVTVPVTTVTPAEQLVRYEDNSNLLPPSSNCYSVTQSVVSAAKVFNPNAHIPGHVPPTTHTPGFNAQNSFHNAAHNKYNMSYYRGPTPPYPAEHTYSFHSQDCARLAGSAALQSGFSSRGHCLTRAAAHKRPFSPHYSSFRPQHLQRPRNGQSSHGAERVPGFPTTQYRGGAYDARKPHYGSQCRRALRSDPKSCSIYGSSFAHKPRWEYRCTEEKHEIKEASLYHYRNAEKESFKKCSPELKCEGLDDKTPGRSDIFVPRSDSTLTELPQQQSDEEKLEDTSAAESKRKAKKSLGRQKKPPKPNPDAEWVESADIAALVQLKDPQDIVETLRKFSSVHKKNAFLLQRLRSSILQNLNHYTAADFSSICRSFLVLGFLDKDFVRAITPRVQATVHLCNATQLTHLLDAYASRRNNSPETLKTITAQSIALFSTFSISDLMTHASSYARLNYLDKKLFSMIAARLKELDESISAQPLTDVGYTSDDQSSNLGIKTLNSEGFSALEQHNDTSALVCCNSNQTLTATIPFSTTLQPDDAPDPLQQKTCVVASHSSCSPDPVPLNAPCDCSPEDGTPSTAINSVSSKQLIQTQSKSADANVSFLPLRPKLDETVPKKEEPLLSARYLTLAAYSFGKLGYFDPAVFDIVARRAKHVSRDFTACQIKMVVVGFQRANIRHLELFEELGIQAKRRVAQFNAESVALVLRSFAQLNIRNADFFTQVVVQLPRLITTFKPKDLLTTLLAFAYFDTASPLLLQLAVGYVQSRLDKFSAQELQMIIHASAALGAKCTQITALFVSHFDLFALSLPRFLRLIYDLSKLGFRQLSLCKRFETFFRNFYIKPNKEVPVRLYTAILFLNLHTEPEMRQLIDQLKSLVVSVLRIIHDAAQMNPLPPNNASFSGQQYNLNAYKTRLFCPKFNWDFLVPFTAAVALCLALIASHHASAFCSAVTRQPVVPEVPQYLLDHLVIWISRHVKKVDKRDACNVNYKGNVYRPSFFRNFLDDTPDLVEYLHCVVEATYPPSDSIRMKAPEFFTKPPCYYISTGCVSGTRSGFSRLDTDIGIQNISRILTDHYKLHHSIIGSPDDLLRDKHHSRCSSPHSGRTGNSKSCNTPTSRNAHSAVKYEAERVMEEEDEEQQCNENATEGGKNVQLSTNVNTDQEIRLDASVACVSANQKCASAHEQELRESINGDAVMMFSTHTHRVKQVASKTPAKSTALCCSLLVDVCPEIRVFFPFCGFIVIRRHDLLQWKRLSHLYSSIHTDSLFNPLTCPKRFVSETMDGCEKTGYVEAKTALPQTTSPDDENTYGCNDTVLSEFWLSESVLGRERSKSFPVCFLRYSSVDHGGQSEHNAENTDSSQPDVESQCDDITLFNNQQKRIYEASGGAHLPPYICLIWGCPLHYYDSDSDIRRTIEPHLYKDTQQMPNSSQDTEVKSKKEASGQTLCCEDNLKQPHCTIENQDARVIEEAVADAQRLMQEGEQALTIMAKLQLYLFRNAFPPQTVIHVIPHFAWNRLTSDASRCHFLKHLLFAKQPQCTAHSGTQEPQASLCDLET